MNAATQTLDFRKTATCPASATLLSFWRNALSAKAGRQVKEHLEHCDFCSAELPLLAHHAPLRAPKAPEMPMNLRILAESILGHNKVRQ